MSVDLSIPSIKNSTFVTATLSVAVALIVTLFETVAPFNGEVIVTTGGVVSVGGLFIVTVIVGEVVEFVAASYAFIKIVCNPFT